MSKKMPLKIEIKRNVCNVDESIFELCREKSINI